MQPAGSDAMGSIMIKKACDTCHDRKVKCDGKQPCSRCLSNGTNICTYIKPARPRGPAPKQKSQSSRDSPRFSPYLVSASSTSPAVRDQGQSTQCPPQRAHPSIPSTQTPSDTSWLTSFDDDAATAFDRTLLTGTTSMSWTDSSDTPWGLIGMNCGTQPACASSDDVSTSSENSFMPVSEAQFIPPPPSAPAIPALVNNTFEQLSNRNGCVRQRARALWNDPFEPFEDVSPILTLTFDTLIRPQLEIFYERIYPMMPIYTYQEIMTRFEDTMTRHNVDFITMMLSMASLSLIHPLYPHEISERHSRAKQSKLLMDEVCRLRAKWNHGCQPSIEGIMTSYCMFGALFEMGQDAGARMRLKEAVSMGESMDLDTLWDGPVDGMESQRRFKVYWMLGVTERAYALQRSGNLVFKSLAYSSIPGSVHIDPSMTHLRFLAKIFSFIDPNIVHCWNGRCEPSTCTSLSRQQIVDSLHSLSGTANEVFHEGGDDLSSLTEVQKADLLVTWQWLRNKLWRLASLHHMTGEDGERELSVDFVVEVASTTVEICKRLSLSSMEAHGTGFVEKLYDIASIITELLQSGEEIQPRLLAIVQTERWLDMLHSLSGFVSRHRGGGDFTGQLAIAANLITNLKMLMNPAALFASGDGSQTTCM
ncbi:hypothetical protein IAU59_004028 [Kwoniella sp. CBS 9459]